jgi:exodeoxyribonuclease VII small subunit
MSKKQSLKSGSDSGKLSFEAAIRALSEIVEKIETGQVPLEESLIQYEKGMSLIGQCRRILLDAEKRIGEIEKRHNPDQKEPESEEKTEDDREQEKDEEALF